MSVEIVVGHPVVEEKHQLEWSLCVDYMHGDANAYSTEEHFYADMNELLLHIEGINFMQTSIELGVQNYDNNCEEIKEFLIEKMEASEEETEEFVERFHQYDTTDESYECDAQIQSVEVYFYDSNGVKCTTTVTVNGNQL